MSNVDVTQLTLEQALELQKKLESALPNLKKQRLTGLQAEIRQLIKAAGYPLDEVLTPLLQNQGGKTVGTEKASRKPAAIKFRLGDKTWTGKGKPPHWYTEHVKANRSDEALRAAPDAEKTGQAELATAPKA